MVPDLPGTGPGTAARQRKQQGREGKEGRKGRKEEGKERSCGAERSGPAARMTSDRREESKRSSGGREGGQRSSQNQKRECNERVTWTTVVAICFIDRTW